MKRFIVFITALLLAAGTLQAQSPKRLKAISLEAGKTGAIINVAFDVKGFENKYGFRLFAGSNFGRYILLAQAGGGVYYLVGKSTKFLELGTDVSYLLVDVISDDQFRLGNLVAPAYEVQTLFTSFNIGYRRYGQKSLFRVGIAPGFTKHEWIPGGYISYGFRF